MQVSSGSSNGTECPADESPDQFDRVVSGVGRRLKEDHLNAIASLEWEETIGS